MRGMTYLCDKSRCLECQFSNPLRMPVDYVKCKLYLYTRRTFVHKSLKYILWKNHLNALSL